ncbi:MAG TPA: serine hydrolase domain-containing protein, partial [Candidatus Elarobacter sp.]|nr:serine hydrolase domain-containing protein [Candidatus Elarobacter sp.]
MEKLSTLLVGLLLAASPTGSAPLGDRITAAVSKVMQRLPAGAAVGVVRNGRLVYAKGFGLRDVAAHKPVDAGTQFEIGSVSKQFTAAAILQLKEVKKLALDDALAKYLPS